MNTAQDVCERENILLALNAEPHKYLSCGNGDDIIVNEKKHTIARDRMKGGVLVWGEREVLHFKWNAEEEKWF
jgi:hypothetical protein